MKNASTTCKATGLVCEFLKDPLGLETTTPRLSWRIDDPRTGARQSAYRLVAASSAEKLAAEKYDLWDTGRVASSDTLDIAYAGKRLRSRSSAFWRVMVWDKDGAPSAWSDTARFEIGLFGKGDIVAKWIGAKKPCTKGCEPVPMFRKAFTLAKEPAKARLHASAFGDIAMSVNGRPASGDLLAPGWTDYRKHVELVTWDVTALLRKGENVIGALLGQGWYAGFLVWKGHRNHYGKSPAFLAQLEVEFADGSRQTVASDTTWKYTENGPVRSSDHYMGEDYDAGKEIPGWDAPGFQAKGWKAAAEIADHPAAALCARLNNGIRRQLELPAKKRTEPEPGRYVFDLGQNMVGWPRLALRGKPGATITIRYAEMLNRDGTLYTANYRSARSTDSYVCRGDTGGAPATFEPHFTFHGFRYVELSGDFATPPECADVTGVVIHTDMIRTGRFECSDPLANRLYSNLNWGHVGNYLDVPTDCPQRDERLGWTGDAQVFVRTAAYNRDIAAFMSKWQRDLDDSQRGNGAYTDVAPDVLLESSAGHCGWADAGVICPWTMYLMYGDTGILRNHYKAMSRWVGYWQSVSTKDGVVRYRDTWHYGDWLAVDCPVNEDGNPLCGSAPTPSDLLSTAYFARSAGIMAEVAKVLGKKADAKKFADLRRKTAAAFRREFVTPGGRVAGDTQTGYLVALGFDLVDDKKTIERMVDRLSFLIESRDCSLTTGFLGTPLLCPVLTRFGRADLAYKLLQRRKYPSWYFQIIDGDATTMWERWNSYSSKHGFGDVGMNSFNHYAYGAVGEWLYATVGGIDLAEPAFRKIRFAPIPGGDITWARASLLTRHGTAAIEWKRSGKKSDALDVKVTVPPNTSAVLELPGLKPREFTSGTFSVNSLKIPCSTSRRD